MIKEMSLQKDFYLFLTVIFTMTIFLGSIAMAIEKIEYDVIRSSPPFELRSYKEYLHASVTISEDFQEAGDKAFSILFKYISGENISAGKIKMTAPVTQEKVEGQEEKAHKIKMTAPVTQESLPDLGYKISFVMPKKWTLKTLPKPKDESIKIEEVPQKTMASIRYTGRWTTSGYKKNLKKLKAWIDSQQDLVQTGEPIWARYNSPFSLWFLRRNEVLIEVNRIKK